MCTDFLAFRGRIFNHCVLPWYNIRKGHPVFNRVELTVHHKRIEFDVMSIHAQLSGSCIYVYMLYLLTFDRTCGLSIIYITLELVHLSFNVKKDSMKFWRIFSDVLHHTTNVTIVSVY